MKLEEVSERIQFYRENSYKNKERETQGRKWSPRATWVLSGRTRLDLRPGITKGMLPARQHTARLSFWWVFPFPEEITINSWSPIRRISCPHLCHQSEGSFRVTGFKPGVLWRRQARAWHPCSSQWRSDRFGHLCCTSQLFSSNPQAWKRRHSPPACLLDVGSTWCHSKGMSPVTALFWSR